MIIIEDYEGLLKYKQHKDSESSEYYLELDGVYYSVRKDRDLFALVEVDVSSITLVEMQ